MISVVIIRTKILTYESEMRFLSCTLHFKAAFILRTIDTSVSEWSLYIMIQIIMLPGWQPDNFHQWHTDGLPFKTYQIKIMPSSGMANKKKRKEYHKKVLLK
jgi:hypothetical protein